MIRRKPKADPRRITVKLREPTEEAARALAADLGVEFVDMCAPIGFAHFRLRHGQHGRSVEALARAHGSVALASLDEWEDAPSHGTVTGAAMQGANDAWIDYQWALKRINVYRAWKLLGSRGNSLIKLGCFDTSAFGSEAGVSAWCSGDDPSYHLNGDTTHGDAIISTLVAPANNGQFTAGVCPDVSFVYRPAYGGTSGSAYDLATALTSLVDAGCKVISSSTMDKGFLPDGTTDPPGDAGLAAEQAAAQYAWDHGAVQFQAADNSDTLLTDTSGESAANLPNVIGVGALAENDLRWYVSPGNGSSRGPRVQFAAPGRNVLVGVNPLGYGTTKPAMFGHTSCATPVTAGVAALIWSANPSLSRADVLSILRDTGDACANPNPDSFTSDFPNAVIPNAAKGVAKALALGAPGSVVIAPNFWKRQLAPLGSEILFGGYDAGGGPESMGFWNTPAEGGAISDGPYALCSVDGSGNATWTLDGDILFEPAAYSTDPIDHVEVWLGAARVYSGPAARLRFQASSSGTAQALTVKAYTTLGGSQVETYTDVVVSSLAIPVTLPATLDSTNTDSATTGAPSGSGVSLDQGELAEWTADPGAAPLFRVPLNTSRSPHWGRGSVKVGGTTVATYKHTGTLDEEEVDVMPAGTINGGASGTTAGAPSSISCAINAWTRLDPQTLANRLRIIVTNPDAANSLGILFTNTTATPAANTPPTVLLGPANDTIPAPLGAVTEAVYVWGQGFSPAGASVAIVATVQQFGA